MAESEYKTEYTVYDPESQQPVTVTVSGEDEAQQAQQVQYITQDGVHILPSQLASGTPGVIQMGNGNLGTAASQVIVNNSVLAGGQTQVIQQAQPAGSQGQVVQVQTPAQVTSTSTANTLGIPQMLFLNQITVNGQTSFVLVDSNNKPVQLPQGIQVINLPQQGGGQPIAMPGETGEEPLYVNAKQYHRILKRRQARAKLEALGRIPKERQKYLYESRHRHALNRQRDKGGIFMNQKPGSASESSSNSADTYAETNGTASQVHILSARDVHVDLPVVSQASDLLCLDT